MNIINPFKKNIINKCKSWSSLFFVLALIGCNSMPSTTEKLHVEKTLIINATAQQVWAFAGEWTGIDNLAPAVITSILSNGNEVGSFRIINLKGGGVIEEEIVDKSATNYSYIIKKSPLPVSNYRSTIGVKDLGDGTSEFSWKSSFMADGVSDVQAIKIITELYEGGLEVLKNKYPYKK